MQIEEAKIRMDTERELAKIRAAARHLKGIEGD